jgi:Zn-dependent peptidase ImmA (M78 family)
VCRDGNGKKPRIEWQADEFSSFLLLPRARVIEAFGNHPPFVFDAQKHGSLELKRLWRSLKPDPDIARTMYASECEQEFELFSQPLAKQFQVSNQVMRIRMEGMGLLKRVRNAALQAA